MLFVAETDGSKQNSVTFQIYLFYGDVLIAEIHYQMQAVCGYAHISETTALWF
jgi:hypothetical protein